MDSENSNSEEEHENPGDLEGRSGLENSEFLDESDVNFDDIPAYSYLPPQDPWRKVKRELIKNLNFCRQEGDSNKAKIDQEWLASEGIQEYVKKVLEEDEDPEQLLPMIATTKAVGEYSCCTAITYLEEDSGDINHLIEPFLDAQGYLIEMHRDLLLGDYNHVAIGLGVQGKRLVLVLGFTKKDVGISTIDKSGDNIVVTGKMLRNDLGVYACRIADTSSSKEKALIGFDMISYDVVSSIFTINIPYPDGIEYGNEGKGKNYVEIYLRGNPETIPYGEETDGRINIKHLKLGNRVRMEIYPDPRQIFEEAKHEERKLLLMQRKQEFEEERRKNAELNKEDRSDSPDVQGRNDLEREKSRPSQDLAPSSSSAQRSKDVKSVNSNPITPGLEKSVTSHEQNESQESSHGSFENSEEEEEEAPQHQVKEDLVAAIKEAQEYQAELKLKNAELEKRVIAIRTKMSSIPEKTAEDSMSTAKYLNTLANVNQVQFKMQELQETYNNWAKVYEENIIEKQQRCKEIQDYFREFKREVAKGAEFARTGKPIPKKTIEDWEADEEVRDKMLQEVRIQNITLKNRLKKLEEQSKEKEKLAEGLHLIDYEQLKIENQTLNEKIEERNEELHKLRKKIETTVQILTHTKEKLKFIVAEKEIKQTDRDRLASQLESQRKELHDCKDKQEKERAGYIKNKQETGIINSKELDHDLSVKKKKVEELEKTLKKMESDYTEMQLKIAKAGALRAR
jgi:Domain of unknown function (DUF4201)